ncbi:hypothetical protein MAR_014314, partial [Mya arenaria]
MQRLALKVMLGYFFVSSSGVHQGKNLSQILFSIFLIDLWHIWLSKHHNDLEDVYDDLQDFYNNNNIVDIVDIFTYLCVCFNHNTKLSKTKTKVTKLTKICNLFLNKVK